jgi:thiol-disulfide isomerase/thioredoxin
MHRKIKSRLVFTLIALLLLSACSAAPVTPAESGADLAEADTPVADNTNSDALAPSPTDTPLPAATQTPVATQTPEWYPWQDMELTDVVTGETFTINDYAGKVILLETMATWCPNCIRQQGQVRQLHENLGNPDDFISISLDVDLNEDEEILKEYVAEWGFDWHFAVSPLLVSRALGNLYTAQYLNPPLDPMMIIDRDGSIEHLPYGIKSVEELESFVQPYFE